MNIRLGACLLLIGVAANLSGCVRSCFKSNELVLNQISIGDESAPEVKISKFPVMPVREGSICQTSAPLRLELYIDTNGYARGVTFLDPWPNDCANEYVRNIERSKLVDAPLAVPLNHFRVDLQYSRVATKQCIKLNP